MTDETCGHPTVDDSECQNAAGENGRCWIPSHNPDSDDENPQGRDFTLDENDHDDILEAAEKGKSKAGCARAAGVSHSQLQRYLDAHDDFRSAFERARAAGESKLIEGGLYREEVNSSFAKFLLASSFDYQKSEKREVDANHEHTGNLEVTSEVVTITEEDVE